MSADDRIYLYDTTLRDGGQTPGVDFSAADKAALAIELDALGIDYIEGGWPGANPTDDAFFRAPPELSHAKLVAFGMTRRPGRSLSNDPGFQALLSTGAKAVCMVGKSWDFQVDVALGIGREENLAMIRESVAAAAAKVGRASGASGRRSPLALSMKTPWRPSSSTARMSSRAPASPL